MSAPIDSIRQGLTKAELRILQPKSPQGDAVIPVRFNPTEYQLQKQNSFADINIPGLETPPIQFIRGSGEKLSTELLVDTSDTLKDVRTEYVDKIRGLMNIHQELHAPPVVQLLWDKEVFCGVLESLNVTYVLFRPDGVPLRARLSVSLKEYKSVKDQIKDPYRNSPDVEKTYTVVRGDTLNAISFKLYRDASLWREIASANEIRDPRRLPPGSVLAIPKIQ